MKMQKKPTKPKESAVTRNASRASVPPKSAKPAAALTKQKAAGAPEPKVVQSPERTPYTTKRLVALQLYKPEANTVTVAGTFNDWRPDATPLQRRNDGTWAVELSLDPGQYEYRFVVDGQWADDPFSSKAVSNPFGGLNAVLQVGSN